MKTFSTALKALLASGLPIYRVDLFKIGPCDNGAMIYATVGQQDISFDDGGGPQVYRATANGSWSRGALTTKIGLTSNSVDLTVFADSSQIPVYFPGTSNGALLLDGIKYGLLGQAPVTIYTAYMPVYGQTKSGTDSLVETKFVGMVGPVKEIGLTKAVITIQDMLYLLNLKVPRKVFQPSCSNTLYDSVCTLSASSFQRTSAVVSVGLSGQFRCGHLTPISTSGTFNLGWLKWTSGKNTGLISMIKLWTSGSPNDTIQLDVAPIFGLTIGDAFQVHQGCNKTFASCIDLQGTTNSKLNFAGQPFVPVPETAI